MPSPTEPTPEQMLVAMARAGRGHVSVSRGALPYVIPCAVRVVAGDVVIDTSHPSVTRGAQRRDIAAVQVEARIDDACWSLSVTGPLATLPEASIPVDTGVEVRPDASVDHVTGHDISVRSAVVVPSSEALFRAECLSSPHGHRVDTLLRSGLAERA